MPVGTNNTTVKGRWVGRKGLNLQITPGLLPELCLLLPG